MLTCGQNSCEYVSLKGLNAVHSSNVCRSSEYGEQTPLQAHRGLWSSKELSVAIGASWAATPVLRARGVPRGARPARPPCLGLRLSPSTRPPARPPGRTSRRPSLGVPSLAAAVLSLVSPPRALACGLACRDRPITGRRRRRRCRRRRRLAAGALHRLGKVDWWTVGGHIWR